MRKAASDGYYEEVRKVAIMPRGTPYPRDARWLLRG